MHPARKRARKVNLWSRGLKEGASIKLGGSDLGVRCPWMFAEFRRCSPSWLYSQGTTT